MSPQWSNPVPPGWPRISISLAYQSPAEAIDWLCRAFGFEVRVKVIGDDGGVVHSELTFGDGVIMVAGERSGPDVLARSPRSLGGACTQGLFIYVDDIQAHYERACAVGAKVTRELAVSDYGAEYWADRGYAVSDPEGHHWHFAQRLRNPVT
ncbi:MAG TPA: VOC family protein [Steroidobacteraceae bacterium]|nr:VOC family protein [Steroidobacteraceae bacterium]